MSYREKGSQILKAAKVLKKYRVIMKKFPDQYIPMIDVAVMKNSDIRQMNLTNILASVIYESEPASRKSIDELGRLPD